MGNAEMEGKQFLNRKVSGVRRKPFQKSQAEKSLPENLPHSLAYRNGRFWIQRREKYGRRRKEPPVKIHSCWSRALKAPILCRLFSPHCIKLKSSLKSSVSRDPHFSSCPSLTEGLAQGKYLHYQDSSVPDLERRSDRPGNFTASFTGIQGSVETQLLSLFPSFTVQISWATVNWCTNHVSFRCWDPSFVANSQPPEFPLTMPMLQ